VNVSFLTPFPGTKLHRMAEEHGWIRRPPEEMVLDEPTMNATAMTDRELAGALAFVRRGFYLRPGYILSPMLTLSPAEWHKNLAGMVRVLGPRGGFAPP
jgi:radical SAM superfamily enzyme YgiQ (UPF0313 family)